MPMPKTIMYIIRQLSFATLFIAGVLTSAVWLTQSLRFVDVVLNKGLPFSTFFALIVYLIPDLIGVVLPIAVLIAVLFVYNRMTADNELIVMRATGMSNWQLASPALILSCTVVAILYSITIYAMPFSYKKMKDLEHEIKGYVSTAMLQEGQFNSVRSLTVYVRKRHSPTDLSGIIIYDARDYKKPYVITAELGSILSTNKGERVVLLNGIRHETNTSTGHPSMLRFSQHIIDFNSGGIVPEVRSKKPHEYFLWELLFPDDDIARDSVQYSKMFARAHYNILMPLTALCFGLLSVCLILSGEYNRRGRSKRLMYIVLGCSLFQINLFIFLHMYSWIFGAVALAYAQVVITITACISYLREWGVFVAASPKTESIRT